MIAKAGKFYEVPCVKLYPSQRRAFGGLRIIPVILPLHDDAEIINFRWQHYHIDWRFIAPANIRKFVVALGTNFQSSRLGDGRLNPNLLLRVVAAYCIEGGIEPFAMRRRCYRQTVDFPLASTRPGAIDWPIKLEHHYAAHRLTKGCFLCPHRGVDLRLGKIAKNGAVVCPGHGLKWDLKTGKLIRRYKRKPRS